MKLNWLNKKAAYGVLIMTAAMFASCSDTDVAEETGNPEGPTEATTDGGSNLTTVKLATFPSSQERVVVSQTRADEVESSLTLIANITNLSKEGKIAGFVKDNRYLSATSVYYDQTSEKYYVTYHMQGNNYNTKQNVETSGYIETFTLGANNVPVPGNVYMAADPSVLAFDFNHLYFDEIPSPSGYVGDYNVDGFTGTRLIAVGHKSEPSKNGSKPNTAAIIAKLNLDGDNASLDYATVYTGDKITEDGIVNNDGTPTSLGNEDAGDVNCVVRKYNHYYLATRKGVAVVKAGEDNLFAPEVDETGHNYFLRTPGSAKYLSQPTFTSGIDVLFLDSDTPESGLTAETSSSATVAELALDTRDGKDCPINITNSVDFAWNQLTTETSPNKIRVNNIESVCPVDGKNMLVASSNNTGAIYACLGKNGLYVNNPTYGYYQYEIIKFTDAKDGTGSRPVNGVFVEDWDSTNGHHYTDGFIYVCNGACLTILDALTLEKVAEYSAFAEGDASANFVHVVRTNNYTNPNVPDRIITVAYGQAGVKVFKFIPPVK